MAATCLLDKLVSPPPTSPSKHVGMPTGSTWGVLASGPAELPAGSSTVPVHRVSKSCPNSVQFPNLLPFHRVLDGEGNADVTNNQEKKEVRPTP